MSDDPDDGAAMIQLLECEDCRATYAPEHFGFARCDEVPHEACCPRCGAPFAIATTWADDE